MPSSSLIVLSAAEEVVKPENDTLEVYIHGTITADSALDKYGNFFLEDGSNSVKIYGSFGTYHVLMYRISPDQDLNYIEERSFLGFKFNVKKKFDTSWHEAHQYLNYPSAHLYSEPQTNPVLMKTQKEFEEWKSNCKTMGEFFARLDEINEKEIEEWKRDREKHLNNIKTWA